MLAVKSVTKMHKELLICNSYCIHQDNPKVHREILIISHFN